jgi:hypothetical protein
MLYVTMVVAAAATCGGDDVHVVLVRQCDLFQALRVEVNAGARKRLLHFGPRVGKAGRRSPNLSRRFRIHSSWVASDQAGLKENRACRR